MIRILVVQMQISSKHNKLRKLTAASPNDAVCSVVSESGIPSCDHETSCPCSIVYPTYPSCLRSDQVHEMLPP